MKLSNPTIAILAVATFCSVPISKVTACTLDFSGKAASSLPGAALLRAAMTPDGEEERRNEPVIVGLWSTTVSQGDKVLLRGFDAYHSDHTEVLNEFHDPRTGNVCLGVWKQTGHRTYKLTHPAFLWDANGNWIGYRILRQTVTVDDTGNGFSGTWSVDRTDTNGNVLSHLDAEIVGTRITVDY
jgi:hypothetical protein